MGKLAIQILFLTFFFAFLLHTLPTTSQEVENEREFDYEKNGERGPARWGELHEEWRACSNGSMQSPIDMLNERVEVVSHLGRLNRSYEPSNATLKNRGHDMMLEWENGAGTIEINGTEYILRQCHWHSPSEHTLDGRRFALELHMVHESPDGKVAVVGVMYTIGRPDSFLLSLTDHLRSISGTEEEERVVGIINPKDIKIGSRKYYRYMGSLTVPPCTENVIWTIVKKVRTVTREQVSLLRVAVHDESDTNARPLQQINGRSVHLYRPEENNDD
ncbi:alpha carbonic anhydrase 7 [Ricinus communis]|uniref:Carbonic anhydrase n=1 Tax=Ricinus communis TaxID=3988 RepID=B9STU9_RICCO|nr:alpha carbonic anhydrase 7 [Ricinus communis]EEF32944.1 carbonic anhydrase, putative [Ricinus communis]|eukprot:XP_002529418.1 alpha carbonic anhydrase 7 [Ricinus communis]